MLIIPIDGLLFDPPGGGSGGGAFDDLGGVKLRLPGLLVRSIGSTVGIGFPSPGGGNGGARPGNGSGGIALTPPDLGGIGGPDRGVTPCSGGGILNDPGAGSGGRSAPGDSDGLPGPPGGIGGLLNGFGWGRSLMLGFPVEPGGGSGGAGLADLFSATRVTVAVGVLTCARRDCNCSVVGRLPGKFDGILTRGAGIGSGMRSWLGAIEAVGSGGGAVGRGALGFEPRGRYCA